MLVNLPTFFGSHPHSSNGSGINMYSKIFSFFGLKKTTIKQVRFCGRFNRVFSLNCPVPNVSLSSVDSLVSRPHCRPFRFGLQNIGWCNQLYSFQFNKLYKKISLNSSHISFYSNIYFFD